MKKLFCKVFAVISLLLLLFVNKTYRVVWVQGNSMAPTLHDKQFCLMKVTNELNDGDIVVVDTKDLENINAPCIIKRYCESKSTAESIYLLGDNSCRSFDSRMFGLIDRKNIIGKVVCQ